MSAHEQSGLELAREIATQVVESDSLVARLLAATGRSSFQLSTEGVRSTELDAVLGDALDDASAISAFSGIPKPTVYRRRQQGEFSPAETDRILQTLGLIDAATLMMVGDRDAALEWLARPHRLLQGNTPRQHSHNETGMREVHDLIQRIEFGNVA